jgi:hypothetical protein
MERGGSERDRLLFPNCVDSLEARIPGLLEPQPKRNIYRGGAVGAEAETW